MAAITTGGTGDWSSTTLNAPWAALTGSGTGGVPGAGDTVTTTHDVTISTSHSVGLTAFTTGGTPAINIMGGSISHTGGTLTASGDIVLSPSGATSAWTMSAGAALVLHAPASQQAVFNFNASGAAGLAELICNGTSGSHCTVTGTAGAGGSVIFAVTTGNPRRHGLMTATYTDFTGFGTTSAYNGVLTFVDDSSVSQNVSITHCTFTSCNYYANIGADNAQSGTFNFSNNTFTSSIANTTLGSGESIAVYFAFYASTSTGAISGNSFDYGVAFYDYAAITFTSNYVAGDVYTVAGGWGSNSFTGNFLTLVNATAGMVITGSISDCYCYLTGTANPHGIGINIAGSISGCIFEAPNRTSGTPQATLINQPVSGGTAITVKNCITLPTLGTSTGMPLSTLFGASTNAVVSYLHNTICCSTFWGISYGESGAEQAGQIAVFKANLVWASSAIAHENYKVLDDNFPTSGGVQNVGSPTAMDYNGSWNSDVAAPSDYPTNTYTFAGNGYQGNFSAYPGAHDVADQNPNFVDSTRNLAHWGGTAAGGGVATIAGALTTLAANPSLITQAITGLIPWVQAGFAPQNTAFEAVSYPGDPSSVDASGGAWPGGSPGIGAMAATSMPSMPFVNMWSDACP